MNLPAPSPSFLYFSWELAGGLLSPCSHSDALPVTGEVSLADSLAVSTAHRCNLYHSPKASLIIKIFFLAPVCCLLWIIFQFSFGVKGYYFLGPCEPIKHVLSLFLLCSFSSVYLSQIQLKDDPSPIGCLPFFLFCAFEELHTYVL